MPAPPSAVAWFCLSPSQQGVVGRKCMISGNIVGNNLIFDSIEPNIIVKSVDINQKR